MSEMNEIAKIVAENYLRKHMDWSLEDPAYNCSLHNFFETLEEIRSICGNEHVQNCFNKLELALDKMQGISSELSFKQGFLYGIGFSNQIKNIDLNNF